MQVTDPNLLNEYERMYENLGSVPAFQLQHYDKLKEKSELFLDFEFNSSIRKLSRAGFNPRSEGFTSKLLTKFCLRWIRVVDGLEERELLLDLISRLPNLFALEFWTCGLDESFFERMADTVRRNAIPLQQLEIDATLNDSLNFEFLFKLRHLERFETDQLLPNELILRLFELPMLSSVQFCYVKTTEKIHRLSTNRFRLNGETLSLQELRKRFGAKSDQM